jgi:serine/threonine protein kinase
MGPASDLGRVFDHYRLLEKLGEGGMGVVWLAEDTRLGRKVALKFLPPEAARDSSRRQRFEQEARVAAVLSHPGIATVHELAEAEGQTYIVFEYVPGKTLRSRVVPGGLQRDELLDVAGDIADALAAAHTAGVVHRDLKPENVIRMPSGHCKVLDFGVARLSATVTHDSATETRSRLTNAGVVVGTVSYMAPEQLEGKEVDFRCDIFSFGTLVYELAAGVHPFQGGSSASTIAAIMTAEPLPIIERNRLQPPELERIVRKCLRKRREERYQSTLDLAVDVANLKRDSAERPGGLIAIAAPAHPDDNESLLRKIFASLGATPRRWWELCQLFGIFIYAPVAYSMALTGSAFIAANWGSALTSLSRGWQGMMQDIASGLPISSSILRNLGLAFFLSIVLLLTTTVATRLYLVWLAVFIPERLLMDVRRIQAVLRVVYSVLACQLAFVGFYVLKMGELILGIELVALGLGTLLAVSYAEPEMVRAAFPKAFAEPERDRSRTLRRRIAAGHLVYALLLVAPVVSANMALNEVMQGISLQPTAAQLGLFAYSVVMTVGSIALLISAVQMLSEGVPALHVFIRWFPVFLAIDFVGTGGWIWMALNGKTPAVIAIGLAIILLVLPFGQLRMARQALGESGEADVARNNAE